MLKLFISMAALFLGVGSSVFAQIEGKVYIDANGNGICDAGERGLKGVCVQDGLNVVKPQMMVISYFRDIKIHVL